MKMFDKIKRLFKKKPSLRERCIEAYGEEFGEIYDKLGTGIPVGNFEETVIIINMIEAVKNGYKKIKN